MRKKDSVFNESYKIDESTHRYMIEIALNQYTDIFSKWDSAPFKRREVDPDLEHYLERSSDEIPLRYPIELCITVPKGMRDERMEEESRSSLENNFNFKLYLLKKELNENNRRILFFLLTGFFLLGIVAIYSVDDPKRVMLSVVEQAFMIGGWVFLWEAISRFFFTNRELYHRYQTVKRMRDAPVIFQEVEKPS